MKNVLYYLTTAIVMMTIFITSSCNRENGDDYNLVNESKQMTLTLKGLYAVNIEMAGSDSVTIDWGDNSAIEKHQFAVGYSKFGHSYSDASNRTIIITGKNIEGLMCAKIQLTGLDVSENTRLTSLYCNHNLLNDIDVSKNTELESFSCNHNMLTSLDVSKNTKLTTLWCHENLLESLDVNKNIALTKLHCDNNRLTIIDMSKNLLLRELYCNVNYLTDLVVNNKAALRELDCSSNRLERLDMANNNALNVLRCSRNQMNADALDKLFLTLDNNAILGGKTIYIFGNPGTSDCNIELAEVRGWEVFPR